MKPEYTIELNGEKVAFAEDYSEAMREAARYLQDGPVKVWLSDKSGIRVIYSASDHYSHARGAEIRAQLVGDLDTIDFSRVRE